jgi:hypothetical protein
VGALLGKGMVCDELGRWAEAAQAFRAYVLPFLFVVY